MWSSGRFDGSEELFDLRQVFVAVVVPGATIQDYVELGVHDSAEDDCALLQTRG